MMFLYPAWWPGISWQRGSRAGLLGIFRIKDFLRLNNTADDVICRTRNNSRVVIPSLTKATPRNPS